MSPSDLLAFEAANPGWSSNKEMRIRGELKLTPPRYLQLLLRAADSAEGIQSDPITARQVRSPGRRERAQNPPLTRRFGSIP